jgi:hypothetical protein
LKEEEVGLAEYRNLNEERESIARHLPEDDHDPDRDEDCGIASLGRSMSALKVG